MTDRPSLNLFLWQKALPLPLPQRVLLAPREMRTQWEAAHRTPLLVAVQTALPSDKPSAQDLMETLRAVSEPRANIARQIDEWFARQLRSGAMIGIGFEPPRRIDSDPVFIPLECWRYGIGSASGKIAVDGLTFAEIRILPRADMERLTQAWEFDAVPPHPAPKRGPRGSAVDIAEAFEALHAAGRIDLNASAKSHYPAIRDWLRHHHPEGGYSAAGPTDETIRKTFQPMFDQARKLRQT